MAPGACSPPAASRGARKPARVLLQFTSLTPEGKKTIKVIIVVIIVIIVVFLSLLVPLKLRPLIRTRPDIWHTLLCCSRAVAPLLAPTFLSFVFFSPCILLENDFILLPGIADPVARTQLSHSDNDA